MGSGMACSATGRRDGLYTEELVQGGGAVADEDVHQYAQNLERKN
jgi:hypothetical protein